MYSCQKIKRGEGLEGLHESNDGRRVWSRSRPTTGSALPQIESPDPHPNRYVGQQIFISPSPGLVVPGENYEGFTKLGNAVTR